MAPKFTFKLNPSSKCCSICLSMTLTLSQCARDWKIENLAETNFAEIFGGARQILSAQCAVVLWQICYLLFYKEYGIIWLVPGVTVACHGPEVFLQTKLNFIMVQWEFMSYEAHSLKRFRTLCLEIWLDASLVQRLNECNREVTIHRPNVSTYV